MFHVWTTTVALPPALLVSDNISACPCIKAYLQLLRECTANKIGPKQSTSSSPVKLSAYPPSVCWCLFYGGLWIFWLSWAFFPLSIAREKFRRRRLERLMFESRENIANPPLVHSHPPPQYLTRLPGRKNMVRLRDRWAGKGRKGRVWQRDWRVGKQTNIRGGGGLGGGETDRQTEVDKLSVGFNQLFCESFIRWDAWQCHLLGLKWANVLIRVLWSL